MLLEMPPDLPPRAFRLRRVLHPGAFVVFVVIGVFFTLGMAGAALMTVYGGPLWVDFALDERGVTVDGTPTSIERTNTRVNNQRVYEVHYTFVDRAGALHAASTSTHNPVLLARTRDRAPMPVDYDPVDPSRARLHGEDYSFFGWIVLLPLVVAAFSLIALWNQVRGIVRRRRVYVHGTAAEARVTNVGPTRDRVNGQRVMRFDYEFDALTGRATGASTSLSPPAVGDRLWILYNPSVPAQNLPV